MGGGFSRASVVVAVLTQAPVAPPVALDGLGAASRKCSVLSSLGGVRLLDNMRFQ
jgi:hypothetical protein